ncbi:transglycosylase domain-containing protein [Candidatus Parcubacteria bacterium]|nr:transglycosylase domain-containing protein [Candidatus Parcubacteria bacterium]
MLKYNFKTFLIILGIGFACFLIFAYVAQKQLIDVYNQQNSIIIKDRAGEIIFIKPNKKGYWAEYLDEVPSEFKKLLIEKEDRYFYYHFGVNPWAAFQAGLGYFNFGRKRASSTITQQIVKILLEKESDRNLKNKIIEAFYSLSLEIFQSKETILKMYANSIYFGNQVQGLSEASQLYFNLSPDMLTQGQILQLLASISSPTQNNPAKIKNKEIALFLTQRLNTDSQSIIFQDVFVIKENMQKYSHSSDSYFELQDLINNHSQIQQATIDKQLTEKIREIVKRNIQDLKPKNANSGAVVIIKLPESELLALIGSPAPKSFESGNQINMLTKPRPIGSTIKPFIYLKAFEKGLRPYTLVDDREYKYITAIGFPLYPKNFDYKYRGEVNLHYALSNSLNVPAVKVLEYIELENFYNFLEKELEIKPVQDLNNYQLGIALGSLEMSLLDLAKYFTIFPNNGILKELKIFQNNNSLSLPKKITEPEYIQLINIILNDRKTGIEQFGLKSDFNLFQKNYALKTGTSRDFHDSWVIGYTPDFLVGVWVGNADNTPMESITGQVGAGRIWAETMELLLNSEYNKKTPFEFNLLEEFYNGIDIEYGLPNDDYEKSQNILKEQDFDLILSPHHGDTFLLENNTKIILKAKERVKWILDGKFLDQGQTAIFIPQEIGLYKIKAESANSSRQTITIIVNE